MEFLFILFDVEVIFMYPWAVDFRLLGLFGLIEMLLLWRFYSSALPTLGKKEFLNGKASDKTTAANGGLPVVLTTV